MSTRQDDIARLRLAAQRLVGPGLGSPVEAVRWMTAMQAQDYNGALESVALRTQGGSVADVVAALDQGQVVRSWPMRGTLHLMVAEDLRWMLELMTPRVLKAQSKRRADLGLDQSDLDRARELSETALSGGRQLRRAELLKGWDDAGLSTRGQRGYHILCYLAMSGVVVFGPTIEGEQTIALLEEWIPTPRRPEREEALRDLALRYFRSHGPATTADFVRWTHLLVADAKVGLAGARDDLELLLVDGEEYFMDPATPQHLTSMRVVADEVLLLPGFDEYVLGYKDRTAQLDPAYAQSIVPGNNGVFKPTVVADGQIVGTWKRTGRKTGPAIEATPFTSFSSTVTAALDPVTACS